MAIDETDRVTVRYGNQHIRPVGVVGFGFTQQMSPRAGVRFGMQAVLGASTGVDVGTDAVLSRRTGRNRNLRSREGPAVQHQPRRTVEPERARDADSNL